MAWQTAATAAFFGVFAWAVTTVLVAARRRSRELEAFRTRRGFVTAGKREAQAILDRLHPAGLPADSLLPPGYVRGRTLRVSEAWRRRTAGGGIHFIRAEIRTETRGGTKIEWGTFFAAPLSSGPDLPFILHMVPEIDECRFWQAFRSTVSRLEKRIETSVPARRWGNVKLVEQPLPAGDERITLWAPAGVNPLERIPGRLLAALGRGGAVGVDWVFYRGDGAALFKSLFQTPEGRDAVDPDTQVAWIEEVMRA